MNCEELISKGAIVLKKNKIKSYQIDSELILSKVLNKPKDTATTSTNIITSEGIKSADNGKLLTWEKIEETNQVGELTADEKAAYGILIRYQF